MIDYELSTIIDGLKDIYNNPEIPIDDIDLKTLDNAISYLSDNSFIEDTPIHILGKYSCVEADLEGDADDEAILRALNLHTFAVSLPNGNILYQNF